MTDHLRRALGTLLFAGLATLVGPVATANAAIVLVQAIGTSTATVAGTTISMTVPASGVAAGDSIIVTFAMPDTGDPTVSATDTAGNVYNVDVEAVDTGLVRTVILSSHNVLALPAGSTITVTHPLTTTRSVSATEFSGLAATGTLDQTQVGAGTGTTPASAPTAQTSQSDELLIGAIGTDGPGTDLFAAGTGYIALAGAGTATGSGDVTIDPEFAVVSAIGAYQATGTLATNRDWAAAIATYVGAPSPTTTTTTTTTVPTTTTTSTTTTTVPTTTVPTTTTTSTTTTTVPTTTTTSTTTTTTTLASLCGNGVVEPGEQCDAGPANGTLASCCTVKCTFQPSGKGCADDGNPCTVDLCNGTSAVCQHTPGNAGAICRNAVGACDVAETCTGTSATCPPDTLQPAGTVCRSAAGPCDVAEVCTGTSAQCPPDTFAATGTVCRPSAGPCDVPEVCSGFSTQCPADAFQPKGFLCRAATGPCDVAGTCSGISASCPADSLEPAGTVCRPSAGPCDVAETCDGLSDQCPADQYAVAGTVCRAPAGPCDVAEVCTGTSVTCPTDKLAPAGTACPDDGNPCTTDTCNGASATCQHSPGNAGVVCRPAAGPCDVAERCTGTTETCPPDALQPPGVVCRPAVDVCDATEACDGTNKSCPADGVLPAGTLCGPAASSCTAPERCDGTTTSCPPSSSGTGPCPCTSPPPASATLQKLELSGLSRMGRNRLLFKGRLNGIPTVPGVNPATNGLRLLIEGAPPTGSIFDVTIPPGPYNSTTNQGWKENPAGTRFLYVNPSGTMGISKVRIKLSVRFPGQVWYLIKGRNAPINGGYPIQQSQLPLTGLIVLDPPAGSAGQCGQATFPGPPPTPSCIQTPALIRCR